MSPRKRTASWSLPSDADYESGRTRRLALYKLMDAIDQAEQGKSMVLFQWFFGKVPTPLLLIIRTLLVSRDKFKPKVNGRPREEIPPYTKAKWKLASAYYGAKRGEPADLIGMIREHVTDKEQGVVLADYFNTAFSPKRPTKRGRPFGSSPQPSARMERRIASVVMRRLASERKATGSTSVPRGHVAATIHDVADLMLSSGEFGELGLSEANLEAVAAIVHRGPRKAIPRPRLRPAETPVNDEREMDELVRSIQNNLAQARALRNRTRGGS